MRSWGHLISKGEGVIRNEKKEAEHYRKASDKGCINAMCCLAQMMKCCDWIYFHQFEAAKYYRMATDKGNMVDMLNYSFMYKSGGSIEAKNEESERYRKITSRERNLRLENQKK